MLKNNLGRATERRFERMLRNAICDPVRQGRWVAVAYVLSSYAVRQNR